MAVIDYFIDWPEFIARNATCESGIIRMMVRDVLSKTLADQKHPDGVPYKDRYYLRPPWYRSYTASALEWCDERMKSKYLEWISENGEITDTTELPVFIEHNTWQNYYDSRLDRLLANSITKEQFEKYKDHTVYIDQERRNFAIMPWVREDGEEFYAEPIIIGSGRDHVSIAGHILSGSKGINDHDVLVGEALRVGEWYDDNEEDFNPQNASMRVAQYMRRQLDDGETTIFLFPWVEY